MSVTATLSSALSGLSAAARAAEVVSSNIANAQTEGYGRRELQLGVRTNGSSAQGVQVVGVRRFVDPVALGERRLADAGAAGRDVRAGFHATLERALGAPTDPASMTARIAAFDAALLEAASRPDSDARLAAVLEGAKALAGTLGRVTDEIQGARQQADARIGAEVDKINATLSKIADLNHRINTMGGGERDASALLDQRQQLIDGLSGILPLREVQRDGGQIALFTIGGVSLLEGSRPAVLDFTPTPVITPDMTLASGALSGLTLNGRPIDTRERGPIGGGSLAAAFALRDELAPAAQQQLDALARDLVGRFADPSPDPTLLPGAPGLFTDNGASFDPLRETGLAGRLTVNAAADPAAGGALWRLRDGLGATAPGPPADASLITALREALTASRGTSVLAAQLVSGVSAARLTAETEAAFSRARADAMKTMELEGGVDTDRELQELLVIEKAYAANAKVIAMVDEMISLLLQV